MHVPVKRPFCWHHGIVSRDVVVVPLVRSWSLNNKIKYVSLSPHIYCNFHVKSVSNAKGQECFEYTVKYKNDPRIKELHITIDT